MERQARLWEDVLFGLGAGGRRQEGERQLAPAAPWAYSRPRVCSACA